MNPSWRFALLGENIHYTKSPAIFAAIGEHLNCSISFEVCDVAAARVPAILESMRGGQCDGLSVTIPHKESVVTHLDTLSDEADQIGAVNCIVKDSGRLIGHNTDCLGFMSPLKALQERLKDAIVMIFGNGGAARAAVYALGRNVASRKFVVVARSSAKMAAVEKGAGTVPVEFYRLGRPNEWLPAVRHAALIVNATPLGGANFPAGGELLAAVAERSNSIYYDLNYTDNNGLIQQAAASGFEVIDGKQMLVAQGIESMRLWSGVTVPFEPVFDKVFLSR